MMHVLPSFHWHVYAGKSLADAVLLAFILLLAVKVMTAFKLSTVLHTLQCITVLIISIQCRSQILQGLDLTVTVMCIF